jgi:hypothetical protein
MVHYSHCLKPNPWRASVSWAVFPRTHIQFLDKSWGEDQLDLGAGDRGPVKGSRVPAPWCPSWRRPLCLGPSLLVTAHSVHKEPNRLSPRSIRLNRCHNLELRNSFSRRFSQQCFNSLSINLIKVCLFDSRFKEVLIRLFINQLGPQCSLANSCLWYVASDREERALSSLTAPARALLRACV